MSQAILQFSEFLSRLLYPSTLINLRYFCLRVWFEYGILVAGNYQNSNLYSLAPCFLGRMTVMSSFPSALFDSLLLLSFSPTTEDKPIFLDTNCRRTVSISCNLFWWHDFQQSSFAFRWRSSSLSTSLIQHRRHDLNCQYRLVSHSVIPMKMYDISTLSDLFFLDLFAFGPLFFRR